MKTSPKKNPISTISNDRKKPCSIQDRIDNISTIKELIDFIAEYCNSNYIAKVILFNTTLLELESLHSKAKSLIHTVYDLVLLNTANKTIGGVPLSTNLLKDNDFVARILPNDEAKYTFIDLTSEKCPWSPSIKFIKSLLSICNDQDKPDSHPKIRS